MSTADITGILSKPTRLMGRTDYPAVGAVRLVRMWPEIAKFDLDGCIAWLAANPSVTDPVIEQNKFTGTYFGGRVWYEWDKPDPEAVNRGLGDKFNLYQELFPVASVTGPTATVEDNCAFTVTAYAVYFGANPVTLPARSTGVQWTADAPQIDPSSGLYTTVVRRRERHGQNTTALPSLTTSGETATRQVQIGIGAPDAGAGALPAIDSTSLSDGQFAEQSVEPLEDCTKRAVTDVHTVVDQVINEESVEAAVTTDVVIHTAADVDLTIPPTVADGTAVQVWNDPSIRAKNKRKTTQTTETVTNQSNAEAGATAAVATTTTINTAMDTASLPTNPPAPGDGEAKTLTIRRSPKFKNRAEVVQTTETVTNQQHAIAQVKPDRSVAETIDTAMDTASLPTNPPVPSAGEAKALEIVIDPKFKNRAKVTQRTETAVKLEMSAKSFTDYDGTKSWYEADNLTETELNTKLAALSTSTRTTAVFGPSREFAGRFYLSYATHPIDGAGSTGDAFTAGTIEWVAVSRAGVSTYFGLKWTTSASTAQTWLTTDPTGSYSHYTARKVDVDGIKTWVHPLGRGRFLAVRVRQK